MPKDFFSAKQQNRIVDAIRLAETNTSGQIRVHVEPLCKGETYARAKEVFEQLGMHATGLKNGVLFYLAYEDKKFAVIGDKGIHEKVTDAFWDEEKIVLETHFKQNLFTEGLCLAIEMAGEKLKMYFPHQSDDTNELTNDISFGGSDA